ncbi:MAG TPA: hypothetical protein VNS62_07100 [Candidatus Udaeobacter sp.]|nr:hypothetical protein [Candidatus Udaeobacter sp.]
MNLASALPIVLTLASVPCALTAQQIAESAPSTRPSPLSLEQVLANLEQKDAQRAAALEQFEGKRIYRMQYHGFPSDRDAEMVVKVRFRAPNSKEFTVLSQTGSKFVIDHIFKKLMESEQEALKTDNRHDMALTRQNYDFELVGYDTTPDGPQYVIKILPKTKNKFLCRGKIWVDAKDFAVVRIEGEPGKNPSMWIKKTGIAHRYVKVDDFWLPAENHTESFIRLGGKATLSIEYQDYKIIKATPVDAARKPRRRGDMMLDGVGDSSAVLTGHIAQNSNQ